VEAAGENGAVVVHVRQNGETVDIEVADSGVALTGEQQQRIFEVFYTTKAHGTGLGLAVSRQLVVEMGGDLHYQSDPEAKAFVISLQAGRGA
jgi:signal transduction histidine kinase